MLNVRFKKCQIVGIFKFTFIGEIHAFILNSRMGSALSPCGCSVDMKNTYTIQSIFDGKFDEEYSVGGYMMTEAKTNKLLLPSQDEETWKLLNETFSKPQPKTSAISTDNIPPKTFSDEMLYLESLFQALGGHKGCKFCHWLHYIRIHGTSSFVASMDISKIESKCTLTPRQNGEEIYSTFFNETLPFMKRMILSMPRIFQFESNDGDDALDNDQKMNDIDGGTEDDDHKTTENVKQNKLNGLTVSFLDPNSDGKCSLSRGQIASILACCFFGIPLYSHCSFAVELNMVGTPGKLEMWIRYFDYVRSHGMDSKWFNEEMVTVWRRCLTANQCAILEHDALSKNETVLSEFEVFDEGCIEDQHGQIHADFANMYIGGGVLTGGNVQEEIRFTVNTECLISKWLSPIPMQINESILIFGTQQFFDYSGYGSRFKFDGYRNVENEMFFCKERPSRLGSCVIAAVDAVRFTQPSKQIRSGYMIREIAKSFIGFSVENEEIGHEMDTVSTGNWGCGIFAGDPRLKSMLQWISVTLSGRKVAYYTFSDRRVAGKLKDFIQGIAPKNVTVGALWSELTNPDFQDAYLNKESVLDMLNAKFVANEDSTMNE